ncbi:hypothetical protein [Leeia oryzae]|uniref:hypothetical protein n=1 Tax=Leeia oryzae TaxID=356662 RepID=UPI00037CBAA6|nr:hypothetical protein [Leeia oryzae]
MVDDAWLVITGRVSAPFKIAFRTWELSAILLLIGCVTATPGDFFKADLVTRFVFFGGQYLAATATFAWITARLLRQSGYPIPFILNYSLLTLLALPDTLVPVVATFDETSAVMVSIGWMIFSLFAFSRAMMRLIPVSKPRMAGIVLAGLMSSQLVSYVAYQFADSTGWMDVSSFTASE